MKLLLEEIFAIKQVFKEHHYYEVIMKNLNKSVVISRENTNFGFFTVIEFPIDIFIAKEDSMWDWNFAHQKLIYGGSFICFKESSKELFLEAVAFDELWPDSFDELDFSDLLPASNLQN